MKKALSVMLVLVMMLALVACSANTGTSTDTTPATTANTTSTSAETTPSTDAETETSEDLPLAGMLIGISASYLEDDFCIEMNYGIVDRLEALGAEVVLQNSNTDGELQTRQIENFVEMGVDYLFVNPPTLDVCVPAMEAAADAGVRMVLFDGGANTDKGVITHVSANNTLMGNSVGEYLADYIKENLDGKATILMESWMEYERHQERMAGVKEKLDAAGLDITYVELDSEGSREGAANVTANYAGDYDLIVCSEMNTAWGAISTLEAQNKSGVKVCAVGDWSKEGFEAIRDGHEYYLTFSTITPYSIADMAVEALLKDIAGEENPRTTYIDSPMVNQDNMDLYWDFEKYS